MSDQEDRSGLKVDLTLDCRGLLCPMPVLKTNAAIKKMKVGQILEMLATDPGAKPDMLAWSKRTKHELLGMEEEAGLFKFYIRKTS